MTDILSAVRQHRIVAALRGVAQAAVLPTARALYQGGVRMLEITFSQTSPTALTNTPEAIRAIRAEFGEALLVGAGTVMNTAQLEAAVQAGAQFVLCPHFDKALVTAAKSAGVGIIPGAFTPSELAAAWNAGASVVKLFPADSLGPQYIKAITAPLSHIPLLAMGGVDEQNLLTYLRLPNMAGVGIGSSLVSPERIRAGEFTKLTDHARRFTEQLLRL